MKRIAIIAIIILAFPLAAFSSTENAASTSRADVATAIAAAGRGGTVNIPAGDASGANAWTSGIVITTGVTIVGNGVDSTIISNGISADNGLGIGTSWKFLFIWQPDETARQNDEAFDISGVWFKTEGATDAAGIQLYNVDASYANKNVKIHACKFDTIAKAIHAEGHAWGVIYLNTFANVPKALNAYGANATTWNSYYPYSFGSEYAIYFEDNTITNGVSSGTSGVVSAGAGGRVVNRYNSWDGVDDTTFLDSHGNQVDGNYGAMAYEAYGNSVINYRKTTQSFIDLRGGKSLIFYNSLATGESYSSGGIDMIEEDYDGLNPVTSGGIQKVNSTYIWSNYDSGVAVTASEVQDCCDNDPKCSDYSPPQSCDQIAENREWYQTAASFDGTAGVGCGTLAARPATCTTGVGYWATDQSCSDLTGLVGAGATALAGTLYKCTSTDTWSAYYTPYSYPHPLRGETTTRTITSSKVGAVGTLSYEGESIVNDGDNSQIYTAADIPNGWKVTWSGTGGCTGNGTTCQVLNVTGDATVIATFTEIKLMPW